MSGVIKVTAADLSTLSGNVSTGANQIQDELNRLQTQVQSVVGGDWMGAASSQFNSLYTEWQTSATNLRSALEGISKLLAQASTQYQQTEDSIKSSFAS